jgi:uncharacterized Zn finger protein (UPF0148 family)
MKTHPHKTYCPACHRLVRVVEQNDNGIIKLNCSVCGRPLWKRDVMKWKEIK